MKGKLSFNCRTTEGMAAFRDAQDGRLWRLSMRELVVYIDNQLERSDNYSEDEIEVLQMVRDQIFEIIRDENLLLWD